MVTFSATVVTSSVPHGPAMAVTPSLSTSFVAASAAACGSLLVSSWKRVRLRPIGSAAALTCVAASSAAWAPGPPKGPSPPVNGTSTPTFSSPTSPPPLSSSPHPAAIAPTLRAPTARSDAIVRRRIIRAPFTSGPALRAAGAAAYPRKTRLASV